MNRKSCLIPALLCFGALFMEYRAQRATLEGAKP